MALTWNLEDIENFKDITSGCEAGITDLVIWGTMFTGIRVITEANYKEFYARYHMLEKLNGAFAHDNTGKPRYLTLEDVERRIGLQTNAANLTRNQFIKLKLGRYFNEIVGKEGK